MKNKNFILIIVLAITIYWSLKKKTEKTFNQSAKIEENSGNNPESTKEAPVPHSSFKKELSEKLTKDRPASNIPNPKQSTEDPKANAKNEVIEYKEIFSGLDTKSSYYRSILPKEVLKTDQLIKNYMGEENRFFTKLIDLKARDLISFENNSSLEKMLYELRNTKNPSLTYINGDINIFNDLSSIPTDTPACKILLWRTTKTGYKYFGKQFFVTKSEVFEISPHISGIRVNFKKHEDGTGPWIQSIECFVKSTVEFDEKYKQLNMLHLFATLGNHGQFWPAKN